MRGKESRPSPSRLKRLLAALLSAALVTAALAPAALATETATVSGNTVTSQFYLLSEDAQLAVTAPTEVNFYLNANGEFTCPTDAYIENDSAFDIEVESWAVADGSSLTGKSKADFDASTDATTPMYYLTATANAANAADMAVGASPSGWTMTATDNADDGTGKGTGTDCLALGFVGAAKNFDISNYATKQTLSTVTWTFKAAEDELAGDAYALILDNSAAAAEVSLLAEGDTISYVGTAPMVFIRSETAPQVGETYDGLEITAVYAGDNGDGTGFEVYTTSGSSNIPWIADWNCTSVTSVTFKDTVKPKSTSYLFSSMSNCTSMDLTKLDTSSVTDMSYMFANCRSLTSLDVSGFDTSNVTSMGDMFSGCSKLTSLDVSGFDTANVTDMGYMFTDCSFTSAGPGEQYDLNLSGFDTSSVTDMGWMFNGCTALTTLDVSGFDTSNVTSMGAMFSGCSKLTSLDLSGFDTSSVTSMKSMFYGCSGLTTIYASDLWNTDKVTSSGNMFYNCTNLKGDIAFDSNYVDKTYAKTSGGYLTDKYLATTTAYAAVYNGDTLVFGRSADGSAPDTYNGLALSEGAEWTGIETLAASTYSDVPWYSNENCKSITSVTFVDTVKPQSTAYWFYWLYNCTSWDLAKLNTSSVTDMSGMFSRCTKLTSLDVSRFDTSSVTNMNQMFYTCKLTSLDLSSFDTSSVTDMGSMFGNCSALTTLNLGTNWNTSSVDDMSSMFYNCPYLTLDCSGWDVSKVTTYASFNNNAPNVTAPTWVN